jgi:membrane-bound lytic murein transglycosylase B
MGYGQFISSSYRAYAVDFDGDEVADILTNPVDAIGSIANYFAKHGWQPGQLVTVPAKAKANAKPKLKNDNLKPKHTVASLKRAGYSAVPAANLSLSPTQSANIVSLNGENGEELWLGLKNFYVITRYNHSRLYAMAVYQLSQMIAEEIK